MIHNQEAAFHVLDKCVSFAGCGTGYLINKHRQFFFPTPHLNVLKRNFTFFSKIVIYPKGDRIMYILMLFIWKYINTN